MTRSNLAALAEAWGTVGAPGPIDAPPTPPPPPWPIVAPAAFHGLAGRYVEEIGPHTEADPVAILVQFLLAFGSVVGRGPLIRVEADEHRLNLYAVIVGRSAVARKGTSFGHVRRLFALAAPEWASTRVVDGLSSGEGLLFAIRDGSPGAGKAPEDPGVPDKRLLVVETEFASVLRVARRDGSTLSPIVRRAWDGGSIQTLTKNQPVRVTAPHVSILGHITQHELVRNLDSTEQSNGLANRFLWILARRSKVLPEGGQAHEVDLRPYVEELRVLLNHGSRPGELRRDEDARELWARVYPKLTEERTGLSATLTARAAPQTLRLAGIYALLDGRRTITASHLSAALAIVAYAKASVETIFGRDSVGDSEGDEILRALRENPDGLTRTEISNLFGRNLPSWRLSGALQLLAAEGLAFAARERTGNGRPAERWRATPHDNGMEFAR